MSGTNADAKPPQSGLVDMGDIAFYNDPSDPTPVFTIDDLENNGTALFDNAFSEIVLNVTWAQLQPDNSSTLDTKAIDSALAQVSQYNKDNNANLGVKLRIWGGYTAPSWAQSIDGTPISVSGAGTVDPQHNQVQSIGRFWTADYLDAWNNLQQLLAAKYDSDPLVRGISNTAGAAATDEPFVPLHPNQVAELVSGGYTDAAEQLVLRAAIADYTSWSTTPLDYTLNLFHLENTGTVVSDPNFTLAVLQAAVTSARIVQAGNHALNNPLPSSDAFVYAQMAAYAALDPSTPPGSYQTASPVNLKTVDNWGSAIAQGLTAHAGDIELWDGPSNQGFTGQPADIVEGWAGTLAAGIPPATGAPDNGAKLAFIAPRSVDGAVGVIALTATDAVLLASASSASAYTVTVVSTGGHTLQTGNFATFANGVTSGPTLSFSGSLDQVNTALANLTDALSQPGVDILQFTASDTAGDTPAVQQVGVTASAGSGSPQPPAPAAPPLAGSGTAYTWTGSGHDTLFSNNLNWTPTSGPPGPSDSATFASGSGLITVSGTGTPGTLVVDTIVVPGGGSTIGVGQSGTGDLDIADQSGTAGMLVLGGVNTSLSVAGNLAVGGVASAAGGDGILLAALAPGAYSTATLTVGGTLQVWDGGVVRSSGALAAAAVDVNGGGTISADGTLSATHGSIDNNGVIEAVADTTLGLQQLTLNNAVAGTGKLLVDPAATLILAGSVASGQTIEFAPNSIAQFANDPYSPSALVLEQPLVTQGGVTSPNFFGTISGFSFADALVLDGFDAIAPTKESYQNGTLTLVDQTTNTTLDVALSGALGGMIPTAIVTGPTNDTTTTITFVAAGLGQLPSVSAPGTLHAVTDAAVGVPDVVLQTPLPAQPNNNTTVLVTVTAANGTLAAGNNNFNTTVGTLNGGQTLLLSGSLGAVERSLQTLTYESGTAGPDAITLTVSDYFGASPSTTIDVDTGSAATFSWAHPSSGDFGDIAKWQMSTPPGGGDTAIFDTGKAGSIRPYTVSGDGIVGTIDVADTVTFTGRILTQAIAVDGTATGGALTLSGGAELTAAQSAVVGETDTGLLTVLGGALDLPNLVIGQGTTSVGTVLDFEQIAAQGSIVVGALGDGALRLLGAAATVFDGGADIGQSAGAHGAAVVDGGFWSSTGTLTIGDAGSGLLTIGGTANGITGQATALDGTIGAQAGGSGTVTLDGGNLLIADDTAGTVSALTVGAAGAGTLAINGGNVTVGAPIVTNSSTVYNGTLAVGAMAGGSGAVTIGDGGALLVEGDASIGAGTVTVGNAGSASALFGLTGSLTIGAGDRVALGGPAATLRASDIVIASNGSLTGAGTVSGDGGGNNTIELTSIDNAGTIAADGDLLVYGSVTGTGALAVGTNSTITLQATVSAGQTLAFGSNATAVLNDALAFAGTITGFAIGDVLDVAGTDATKASWANGTLTLTASTGPIALHVAGSYAADGFIVQSDGFGGTKVELPCFAAGTRILTPNGLVAVEALAVGDRVVTVSGTAQPIQWIGWRRVDCRRHPNPEAVWPVRIKAGAFAPGCPERDVFLSPDHAVYVDGVLIPVRHLLNGRSLRQMRVKSVTYYHVELARHDVVLAEGLPAETFLDTGNRSAFANAPGVVTLHPDFGRGEAVLAWDAHGYAPLCVTGPVVDAVRASLRKEELLGARIARGA